MSRRLHNDPPSAAQGGRAGGAVGGSSRRAWLTASIAGVAAMACGTARADPDSATLDALCRDLYVYGFPVLEMARARQRTIGPSANRLRHVRRLADATSRRVTTPNNDTLYSSAWLDLRHGPVAFAYPGAGDRYVSIAVLDMFSNNFIVLGPQQTRGLAGAIRLAAPGAANTPGTTIAPTPWVWIQARTLVAGHADLAAAHQLQDAMRLSGADAPPPEPLGETGDPVDELLAIVHLLATDAPPPPGERDLMARWDRAGLTRTVLAGVDGSMRSDAARGVAEARRRIAARMNRAAPVSGWIYPEPALGDFGTDFLYRASIAQWGLGALPVREAAYFRAVDRDGDPTFSPAHGYLLRFPPGGDPPARAFWSLSLYEALADGQLYFAGNPLDRFAIGDRTPSLIRDADGSLSIWIGTDDPGASRRANWLPAPNRRFALILRVYNPEASMFDGTYRVPQLEVIS